MLVGIVFKSFQTVTFRPFDVLLLTPGLFRASNLHCERVNLNFPLPYENSSFDVLICANAVHRLANVGHTIAELYRVIRPGGRLYLNMNNYSSIDVHIRFLLCGSLEYRPPEWEINAEGDPQTKFRQHVMYGHVANCLESVGFHIERVMPSSRVPMIQKVMIPLALMVKICTRMLPNSVRTQNQTNATSTLSILTGGHYVMVDAIKK